MIDWMIMYGNWFTGRSRGGRDIGSGGCLCDSSSGNCDPKSCGFRLTDFALNSGDTCRCCSSKEGARKPVIIN